MKAPGSEVTLTYQTDAQVAAGDVVVTARTGRGYLVRSARRMRSSRPGSPCWSLRCVVLAPGDDTGEARRHPLHWWPRPRRRPR